MRIGSVELSSNLLLAPIAGYTDLAFRHIVRRVTGRYHGALPNAGVGLCFTELLCPEALRRETLTSQWRARSDAEDSPLGYQIYGNDAELMCEAARWAEAQGATIIDINMGCPVDKVTKKHGGSKLLCDPTATTKLAGQIVKAVNVPVTAKIRLGWDEHMLIHDTLPAKLADVGIAAVTVHGRTTRQRFKGEVQLEGIAQTVEAMAKRHPGVPVIGNGDVRSPGDAKRMVAATGCAGVMIGRGALGQPWLFRDAAHYLATGRMPEPVPRVDRAKLLLEHIQELARLIGDDGQALQKMRGRINWYSAHLQPWPGFRRGAHECKTLGQMIEFIEDGIGRIADRDAVAA